MELPQHDVVADIHCVTSWTKLDTRWRGVSVEDLLDAAAPAGDHAVAFCDGGYTTNLPVADLRGRRAWIVYEYDGGPVEPAHGGPARLLVPHLYLWKSAKWVRGIRITAEEEPGFWEVRGYHLYGDPWREQRYWGD
jgi:DMSO/TMAO reductase YedYZ molybdopterin-dependent catalytic subunit